MYYFLTPIKWALLIAFVIFAVTFTSGLILIAFVFLFIFGRYLTWTKKTCDTCGKRIGKKASVCMHCNTIQSN
jgi:hypothetical protein